MKMKRNSENNGAQYQKANGISVYRAWRKSTARHRAAPWRSSRYARTYPRLVRASAYMASAWRGARVAQHTANKQRWRGGVTAYIGSAWRAVNGGA